MTAAEHPVCHDCGPLLRLLEKSLCVNCGRCDEHCLRKLYCALGPIEAERSQARARHWAAVMGTAQKIGEKP